MSSNQKRRRYSLAEKTGIGALLCALALWPIDARWAVLPAGAFILLCFAAPFFPGFGFFVPIVSRGRTDRPAVALTFDDGPDPVSTPILLDLLDRHQARATFFLNGRKARRHPELVRDILARGHTVGNHTHTHDNFIMFKSHATLVREIEDAQAVFRGFGIAPLAFRPPVGVTSPRLRGALDETGLFVVNFSRRAGDRGNRSVSRVAARILGRLRRGDIIMLHDTEPRNDALSGCWREQVDAVLAGIRERGMRVQPLADLIGRPVMRFIETSNYPVGRRPVV